MVLLLKKLSLSKLVTLQLSLNKLARQQPDNLLSELIFNKPSMEISLSFIPVPRNGKLGWYEKFKQHNSYCRNQQQKYY